MKSFSKRIAQAGGMPFHGAKSPRRERERVVFVRMTEQEHAAVERAASYTGSRVGVWARLTLLHEAAVADAKVHYDGR
jgi:hypothetical protein